MNNHGKNNNFDTEVREIIVEKNRGFSIAEVLFIIFITLVFGFFSGYYISSNRPRLKNTSDIEDVLNVYNEISNNFYNSYDKNKLIDSTIFGMVSSLDDKYSNFTNYLDIDSKTYIINYFKSYGIIVVFDSNNNIIIQENFNKSLDFNYGSIINSVSEFSLEEYNVNDLCVFLRNYKSDSIKISVKSDYEITEFILQDKIVEDISVFTKKYDNIGLIKIDSFGNDTFKQFVYELSNLEKNGIDSLIIDVRDNYGGKTGQVNSILDIFISKGKVLYNLEGRGEIIPVLSHNNSSRNYPIVLLVNGNTASAAEILVSGLKDNYGNIKIIGTKTYGKGRIQKEIPISTGSSVRISTKSWTTSRKESIDGIGINPDILITNNNLQLEEAIKTIKET